jgi:hypothetical protein
MKDVRQDHFYKALLQEITGGSILINLEINGKVLAKVKMI